MLGPLVESLIVKEMKQSHSYGGRSIFVLDSATPPLILEQTVDPLSQA